MSWRLAVGKRGSWRSSQEVASDVNILFLNHCHESLSEAIQVEADATLTMQGRVTDPVS